MEQSNTMYESVDSSGNRTLIPRQFHVTVTTAGSLQNVFFAHRTVTSSQQPLASVDGGTKILG
jgi:hypothetical protein